MAGQDDQTNAKGLSGKFAAPGIFFPAQQMKSGGFSSEGRSKFL
jgi:hypothetical protein